MDYSTLLFEVQDAVGIIRLNRPDRMNAVIEEMYLELQDVLSLAASADGIRSLIVTGSTYRRGDVEKQAFCAGADLKKHASGERSKAEKRRYIELAHETTRSLFVFPKPTIAAVNGPARGAGAELALNCDFVIMATGATIGFPEIGLGTFVGGGVTSHLVRIVGLMKAKELVYSGRILTADEAVQNGLALRAVDLEVFEREVISFAEHLSEQAPISLRMAKMMLQRPMTDLETTLRLETDSIVSCMDTEDWIEGVRAFKEKRKPNYKGK